MADRLGRKKVLLLSACPALIGYICLAAGTSVGLVFFARILSGLVIGMVFTVLPMYCGEIAHVRRKNEADNFLPKIKEDNLENFIFRTP